MGARGAPIVAAFVLAVAAYLQARIPGHIPFTMIVPGLLQLAPGFLGTEATFKMLTVGEATSGSSFFDVIVLAVQLGIGILAASLLLPAAHAAHPRARAPAKVTRPRASRDKRAAGLLRGRGGTETAAEEGPRVV